MPANYGEVLRYGDEDLPELIEPRRKTSPLEEVGTTGLKRATGIIDEEFLPALRGRKAVKVYREMSLNDPIVGAMLFSIDKLCRQVTWRVEGNDNTAENAKAVEFVEQCMDDMSHTWNDMVSEILSMLVYGWSWHEIVYKKRVGPWEKDPKKRSKYTDGLFGWRKIPIRSQETMLRWIFDESGGVQGMVQIAPPYYKTAVMDINRSLLFRTGLHKGNPEGVSILRTAYRPWFFKKRLEEFEAIGVERDLAGLPVAKVPSSYMKAAKGSNEEKVYQAFKRMVQNVRRDEHEGLVLPNEYDPDTKQPLFEFELLSAGGTRSFDTNALIQRYEQRILMSTMADWLLLGHESVGSYAMHVDKTGIFRAAMNVVTDAIADVFNRHAIPRLFELNAWKPEELPKIVPNNVDPPNLTELAGFMTSMSNLGMQFFPDPDLEKFLRETSHLPEIPDDVLEQRRQMALEQNAAMFAESQMMTQGMQMKADLVGRGMTPEQAELEAQTPHPEGLAGRPDPMALQQQEMQMQGDAQKQDMDLKMKAMDLQSKEHETKLGMTAREKDHQLTMAQREKEAKFADRDHARDQAGKDKDYVRDQKSKDNDVKRQEALARLKERMTTSQMKAKAKADQERKGREKKK